MARNWRQRDWDANQGLRQRRKRVQGRLQIRVLPCIVHCRVCLGLLPVLLPLPCLAIFPVYLGGGGSDKYGGCAWPNGANRGSPTVRIRLLLRDCCRSLASDWARHYLGHLHNIDHGLEDGQGKPMTRKQLKLVASGVGVAPYALLPRAALPGHHLKMFQHRRRSFLVKS